MLHIGKNWLYLVLIGESDLPLGDDLEIWFSETLAGLLAARDRGAADAAAHWARARDAAQRPALRGTPFDAVGWSNLAATGAPEAASRAAQAWADVAGTVEAEDLPLPARSSVFHLMLASRHAVPFSTYLRTRARTLARLGAELAQANAHPDATDLQLHANPDVTALPEFLSEAVRWHRDGRLGPADALGLVNRQIAHVRAYGGALPRTFRAQIEACLGFCAFAPPIAALHRDGAPPHTPEV